MESRDPNQRHDDLALYTLRVAIAVGVAVVILTLLALLWLAADVLLLGFAGVLVAVLLRSLANLLAKGTGIRGGWSILLVIVFLASLLAAGCWLAASPLIHQFGTLAKMLRLALEHLQAQLSVYELGDWLVKQAYAIDWMSRRFDVLGKMTGALSTAFGATINVVIIGFLGLYLSVQPDVYINGAVRLLPVSRRPRIRHVIAETGRTLQWWLVGTLCSMTIIGVLSGTGLWLLGVPFALALGLLAALLSFVPYLGAIVSAIPAMLIALINGPRYALYVAILYLVIHTVEAYLLSPVIQQYAVSLPPALLLFAQIMMGLLVGGLGVILATPIAATLLVIVNMLYVEDVLGDDGTAPS